MDRTCILRLKVLHLTFIWLVTLCGSLQAQEVLFKKITLTKKFYGEAIHLVDLNRDGEMDLISGPYIYAGPDFTSKKTYYKAEEFDPHRYGESYFITTYDFNGDGHLDIFKFGRAGHRADWYANPGTDTGEWKQYLALEAPGNEARHFTDLDNDGRPEAVFMSDGSLALGRPDWKNVEKPWSIQKISRDMSWNKYTPGMGVGDINGDGLSDVIVHNGWWEQPAKNPDKGQWIEHAFVFFPKIGSQMLVYDVNDDGKNDIISSLHNHGYGLVWFEQKKSDSEITFEKHMIMGNRKEFDEGKYPVVFSQIQTMALGDINGDGLMDFATGKRHWARGPDKDPEAGQDPVLYWFELVRKSNTIKYIPHLMDDQSGAGVTMETGDIDKDGTTDIMVANKYGAYVFFNQGSK